MIPLASQRSWQRLRWKLNLNQHANKIEELSIAVAAARTDLKSRATPVASNRSLLKRSTISELTRIGSSGHRNSMKLPPPVIPGVVPASSIFAGTALASQATVAKEKANTLGHVLESAELLQELSDKSAEAFSGRTHKTIIVDLNSEIPQNHVRIAQIKTDDPANPPLIVPSKRFVETACKALANIQHVELNLEEEGEEKDANRQKFQKRTQLINRILCSRFYRMKNLQLRQDLHDHFIWDFVDGNIKNLAVIMALFRPVSDCIRTLEKAVKDPDICILTHPGEEQIANGHDLNLSGSYLFYDVELGQFVRSGKTTRTLRGRNNSHKSSVKTKRATQQMQMCFERLKMYPFISYNSKLDNQAKETLLDLFYWDNSFMNKLEEQRQSELRNKSSLQKRIDVAAYTMELGGCLSISESHNKAKSFGFESILPYTPPNIIMNSY